jgi:hypothetical protein
VWLNYTRLYERLGGATPTLAFTQHVLAVAADDWRPAVAFLNARHPDMFEPNADANALDWEGECSCVYRYILRESCSQIDSLPLTYLTFACIALDWEGPGSYADLRGPIDFPAADAPHYAAMGYKLNWDSSARFPWHGDWVPTDADGFNGKNWTSCFTHDAPDGHLNENCSTFSYAEISGWYAHQRSLGFRTCNYANLFQFGWNTAEVWATDTTGGGGAKRGRQLLRGGDERHHPKGAAAGAAVPHAAAARAGLARRLRHRAARALRGSRHRRETLFCGPEALVHGHVGLVRDGPAPGHAVPRARARHGAHGACAHEFVRRVY